MRWTRWLVGCVTIPVAFTASCVCFIPLSLRAVDPLARAPVDSASQPFPIVVVSGEEARVAMLEDPHRAPPPGPGESYLVPLERTRKVEQFLRDHETPHRDSGWVLRAADQSPGRQRIELYLLGDGYWGGVYEATATTIVPLYRKIAGPAFPIFAAPVAVVMNVVLWGVGLGGFRVLRLRRRKRGQSR